MIYKLKVSVPFPFLLFLTGLKSIAQDYYYTNCDSFKIDDGFVITEQDEHEFKHSFSVRTFVYCSPDSTQTPLGFVNFNTTLTTLETVSHIRKDSFVMYSDRPSEYRYIYHSSNWKKVNFRGGVGYVKANDLADEYYPNGQFLLQSNRKNYGEGVQLKAISAEPKMKRSLDKITLPFMHGYRLQTSSDNGLKNSGLLIIYETFRQSCPGASSINLVLLNKNGFHNLISSFSTGEAGMFEHETIYYPLKLANASIKLIAVSDIMYAQNEENELNLNTISGYPYPNHIGIPIEQLIVKTKSYTENILDENGKELMDENSNYRVNIINEEPVFYEWNGDELIELGSLYYLNRMDSLIALPTDSIKIDNPKNQVQKVANEIAIDDCSTFSGSLFNMLAGFFLGGLTIGIIFLIKRQKR